MELRGRGDGAALGGDGEIQVTLAWEMAADLDLAAFYEDRAGGHGLIYFGEPGDMETFPHMALSGDAGDPDAAGPYEETLRIGRMAALRRVWLLCWDYEKVQRGAPAPFTGGPLALMVTAADGGQYRVIPDAPPPGNVMAMAVIETAAAPDAAESALRLRNVSRSGTLRGLRKLAQIMAVVAG